MQTETATRVEPNRNGLHVKGDVAIFQPPRLPYHDAIHERYGVDRSGWKALVEACYPNAKTVDSVVMVLSYCKARNLDPFKRVAHIVPMWSTAIGKMVETVWPGIAEARTTAFRTENFAGMEAPEFGPTIERTFEGTATKGYSKGETRKITVSFPEWCRITIVRDLHGKERRFVGPKTYWLETYAKWADTEVPNDMWARRPSGQLEKCSEAAALRRAFPEEIGNEYYAEEMEGQRLTEPAIVAAEPPTPPGPPAVDAQIVEARPGPETKTEPVVVDAAPVIVPTPPETTNNDTREAPPGLRPPTRKPAKTEFAIDMWLVTLATECKDKTPAQLMDLREKMIDPMRERVGPEGFSRAEKIWDAARKEALLEYPPSSEAHQWFDADQWYRDLEGAISGCTSAEQVFDVQTKVQMPAADKVSKEHYAKGKKLVAAALMQLANEG